MINNADVFRWEDFEQLIVELRGHNILVFDQTRRLSPISPKGHNEPCAVVDLDAFRKNKTINYLNNIKKVS